MADWHCYQLDPIDFGRERLVEVDEVLCSSPDQFGFTQNEINRIRLDLQIAKSLAKKVNWDGTFRSGRKPRLLPLVSGSNSFVHGFVWKQENNGETFVLSPVPLKQLEDVSIRFGRM
ncbi:hypothetical protein [Chthonobacter albigriseus]|uniref:hypothetical protein n=1 Tax=Chthonobacter albigriseus TaxID=1683161 RepID=UPI0015EE452A|nr:hypothetical protein [Chthonobacter albigriseus]